jgi:hypothetical protein
MAPLPAAPDDQAGIQARGAKAARPILEIPKHPNQSEDQFRPAEIWEMTDDTDIFCTERDLIPRAINSAMARHISDCIDGTAAPKPRWLIVHDLFGCDLTVAKAICYRYGYDPEKMIGDAE